MGDGRLLKAPSLLLRVLHWRARGLVANTTPLRYLAEIGELDAILKIFRPIIAPASVLRELSHPHTPQIVRMEITKRVAVRQIVRAYPLPLPVRVGKFSRLHRGEKDAIRLALERGLPLAIDEADAREVVQQLGRIQLVPLLRLLRLAQQAGHTRIGEALAKLARTTFRMNPEQLERLRIKWMRDDSP